MVDSLDPIARGRFDAVIDVRSPAEFAQDHVSGAVNLPVLDDAERAAVGTVYGRDSKFRARRMGAALIARNVAHHLETSLSDRGGEFRPLVYCWRGGQRSHAMAVILSQIGWRTGLLRGGYRTYRRAVQQRLYEVELPLDVVLLDGPTGSAKTEILQAAGELGVQIVDLEGIARHRGSLFGGFAEPQPSQKLFESRLVAALDAIDPLRPVLIEAESNKIGERLVPPRLWRTMVAAPRIVLDAPRRVRAAYLVEAYADIIANPASVPEILAKLPQRPMRVHLAEWTRMAAAGEFEAFADALAEHHYDPAYARSSRLDARPVLATLPLDRLDGSARAGAALQIAELLAGKPR